MLLQKNNGFQKSLYIFLSSLLGVLLFLVIHRLLVFMYLMLQAANFQAFNFGLSYYQFLAWDYFTLLLSLMFGAWYGIWLGSYWYEKVYNEGSHPGLVGHIAEHYWPKQAVKQDLKARINEVKHTLHSELIQLDDLAKAVNREVKPVKRAAPRKRVVKKKSGYK